MLYEVREGPCLESFGIHVATMAGFPRCCLACPLPLFLGVWAVCPVSACIRYLASQTVHFADRVACLDLG